MKSLMVVDFNNILFRYLDIHSDKRFAGRRTGGVYGFLTQLCYLINLYKPTDVIVTNDFPPYKRKELFNKYKQKRKEKEFDLERSTYIKESKIYCRELLDTLNIPLWEEKGYESDDLMGILVHKNKYLLDEIILVSNDDDLFALLNKNVFIHRKNCLYSADDFINEYKIHPSEWSEVEALCGTHNGIPSLYPRLGRKTALKIYKDRERLLKVISDYKDQYLMNLSLILLPIDFKVEIKPFNRQPFTFKKIENLIIQKYGITVTKAMNDCFAFLNETAFNSMVIKKMDLCCE